WYIRNLAGSVIAWGLPWGWPGALPISGDYDGDGAFDMAVFDTSSGCWYVKNLAGSVLVWAQPWGWPGAWPVGWGLWRP
ncbi:MAG: VCBS repeat-containing protein, partial [Lentisphaerae bacterium]|nr:VCBS repeat-containing protein [Lentisphaerota bacterium]